MSTPLSPEMILLQKLLDTFVEWFIVRLSTEFVRVPPKKLGMFLVRTRQVEVQGKMKQEVDVVLTGCDPKDDAKITFTFSVDGGQGQSMDLDVTKIDSTGNLPFTIPGQYDPGQRIVGQAVAYDSSNNPSPEDPFDYTVVDTTGPKALGAFQATSRQVDG